MIQEKISTKDKIYVDHTTYSSETPMQTWPWPWTHLKKCTPHSSLQIRDWVRIHDTGELTVVVFFITGKIIYNANEGHIYKSGLCILTYRKME